jgi:FtsP/CotA-like multicopper oxidase with cupredoxin domain
MAIIEYWIQIENHPWDASPNNIDRMTGQTIKEVEEHEAPPGHDPVDVSLISPVTGVMRTRRMYKPLRVGADIIDALILRRYTANWAAPADRKVNPWDLNEPDPTDNGTMGTIPGPVIECNIGDQVIVHFRNMDTRAGMDVPRRAHSLHPHGFVFALASDGAYPLSPPDSTQPVGAEAALWAAIGVNDFKKGDRVPPGGTFNYTWNTFRWPTTAGVWLYHDHSVCDMDNVQLGAIGIIVIHNPDDPDDVIDPPLPGGSFIGSPTRFHCFPFPFDVPVLPHDLNRLGLAARGLSVGGHAAHGGAPRALAPATPLPARHKKEHGDKGRHGDEGGHGGEHEHGGDHDKHCEHCEHCDNCEDCTHCDHDKDAPLMSLAIHRGDIVLEPDHQFQLIRRFCIRRFREPPDRAQYLQLFHNLTGVMMCINGRKYLGNTPTVVAGLTTKMRFGLVGMGNADGFHTFHLHGHRWIIPGPDGNTPAAIQASIQNKAVSQFEDTRTFGPANSFAFTINQGSFMGSLRAPEAPAVGEWHMHCHVLNHMMEGMMGSLLIVRGGELFFGLPSGEPCHMEEPVANTILVKNLQFSPSVLAVAPGTVVNFDFQEANHTVMTTSNVNADPVNINNGGGPVDAVPVPSLRSVVISGSSGGSIQYQCGIHGATMTGTIQLI